MGLVYLAWSWVWEAFSCSVLKFLLLLFPRIDNFIVLQRRPVFPPSWQYGRQTKVTYFVDVDALMGIVGIGCLPMTSLLSREMELEGRKGFFSIGIASRNLKYIFLTFCPPSEFLASSVSCWCSFWYSDNSNYFLFALSDRRGRLGDRYESMVRQKTLLYDHVLCLTQWWKVLKFSTWVKVLLLKK